MRKQASRHAQRAKLPLAEAIFDESLQYLWFKRSRTAIVLIHS
jgi:hypothetical protein